MDERLVDVCGIVTTLTFIFLIQKIIVRLNVSLSADDAWPLLVLLSAFFLRNWFKLISNVVVVLVLLAAEHHDARLGAEHNRNADEYYDDQHFRDLLLAFEEVNV